MSDRGIKRFVVAKKLLEMLMESLDLFFLLLQQLFLPGNCVTVFIEMF